MWLFTRGYQKFELRDDPLPIEPWDGGEKWCVYPARSFNRGDIHSIFAGYPLVMTNITMERSTIFHGKNHYKWWFSIVMLNYQRVNISSAVVESLFVHWCRWLSPGSSWFIQKLHSAICAGQIALFLMLIPDIPCGYASNLSTPAEHETRWCLASDPHFYPSFTIVILQDDPPRWCLLVYNTV